MTETVKGLVLAGNAREYGFYLFKHRLKGKEYPRISLFNQLQGYHDTPPVICVGTYYMIPKLVEVRERAKAMGATVVE